VRFLIKFSDWQEGSTVSFVICDRWWHLKVVAIALLYVIEDGPLLTLKSKIGWLGNRPALGKYACAFPRTHASCAAS